MSTEEERLQELSYCVTRDFHLTLDSLQHEQSGSQQTLLRTLFPFSQPGQEEAKHINSEVYTSVKILSTTSMQSKYLAKVEKD